MRQKWKIELSNARSQPVHAEVKIPYKLSRKSKNIIMIDGVPTWKTIVPANGSASLQYNIKLEVAE